MSRASRKISIIPIFAMILGSWTWALTEPAQASPVSFRERDFVEAWCAAAQGIMEVRQADQTRIDCVAGDYAVEFDFGPKWAEALGQALFYSAQSGLKPGIVLILKEPGEGRFLTRLEKALRHHGLHIRIWVMRPEDLLPASTPGAPR